MALKNTETGEYLKMADGNTDGVAATKYALFYACYNALKLDVFNGWADC